MFQATTPGTLPGADLRPPRGGAPAVTRLHVVTDDGVLAAPDFPARARRAMEAADGRAALHLRGHGTPVRRLLALAGALVDAGTLLVNDRLDVALAAGAAGVQLGRRGVPVAAARRVLGADALLGYSAHGPAEAAEAAADGTDFVLLGTIYGSASHPGATPAGPAALRAAVDACPVPVLAIGGITPERVAPVLAAGAHGVAVLGGVWAARDETAAVRAYLAALDDALRDALADALEKEGSG
ncbi:MAG: thiamine phosphate synthase [Gemmatimonadota bacterium]